MKKSELLARIEALEDKYARMESAPLRRELAKAGIADPEKFIASQVEKVCKNCRHWDYALHSPLRQVCTNETILGMVRPTFQGDTGVFAPYSSFGCNHWALKVSASEKIQA